MALIITFQQLIIFSAFASVNIASPLDAIHKPSLRSEVEPVKPDVDLSDGINGVAMIHAFNPSISQSPPCEPNSEIVENHETQVDTTHIGGYNEGSSGMNEIDISTFLDQSLAANYDDNVKPDAQVFGTIPATDNSVEDTFMSQDISHRDATEAMGYHNYAMVCAQSKVHTDYCTNRRRGYYCSQNGFLQIHADGTRYVPCEDLCVCVDTGVKPVCRPMQLLGAGSRTNC